MSPTLTVNRQTKPVVAPVRQNSSVWSGLGKNVSGLKTAEAAIKAANLDWEVGLKPVWARNDSGSGYDEIADSQAIYRKDNQKVLAVLGNRYHPIQNSEAFRFFDEVVGEGQAVYDFCGSVSGGRRVWILARLNGKLFLDSKPDDISEKFVLLVTSHDGSSSLSMQTIAHRISCANQLSVTVRNAENQIKLRHTPSYEFKKEEAMRALKLCSAYFDNLQEVMNELDKQKMSQSEMDRFAEELIPMPKNSDDSTRTLNIRDTISCLFTEGLGNTGKSRWHGLCAVTEFVDHIRATRVKGTESFTEESKNEGRFLSSTFGSGAKLKERAFQLLTA